MSIRPSQLQEIKELRNIIERKNEQISTLISVRTSLQQDNIRLNLRLDACLYAMILMQSELQRCYKNHNNTEEIKLAT